MQLFLNECHHQHSKPVYCSAVLHPNLVRIKCCAPEQGEKEEEQGENMKTCMWAGMRWYPPLCKDKIVAHECNLCIKEKSSHN